jgi:hypothetical protein
VVWFWRSLFGTITLWTCSGWTPLIPRTRLDSPVWVVDLARLVRMIWKKLRANRPTLLSSMEALSSVRLTPPIKQLAVFNLIGALSGLEGRESSNLLDLQCRVGHWRRTQMRNFIENAKSGDLIGMIFDIIDYFEWSDSSSREDPLSKSHHYPSLSVRRSAGWSSWWLLICRYVDIFDIFDRSKYDVPKTRQLTQTVHFFLTQRHDARKVENHM